MKRMLMLALFMLAAVSVRCELPEGSVSLPMMTSTHPITYGMYRFTDPQGYWHVASVRWDEVSVLADGKAGCHHDWIFSAIFYNHAGGCAVYHADGNCSMDAPHRKKICRKCGMHIEEQEVKEMEWIPAPQSEYDKAVKKWSKRWGSLRYKSEKGESR